MPDFWWLQECDVTEITDSRAKMVQVYVETPWYVTTLNEWRSMLMSVVWCRWPTNYKIIWPQESNCWKIFQLFNSFVITTVSLFHSHDYIITFHQWLTSWLFSLQKKYSGKPTKKKLHISGSVPERGERGNRFGLQLKFFNLSMLIEIPVIKI